MKKINIVALCLMFPFFLFAQKPETFTHADTLRGSVTPERAWWDVMKYDISVQPNYKSKTISASVTMSFKVVENGNKPMQIDLQDPMMIDSVKMNNQHVAFKKIPDDKNAWYIQTGNHKKGNEVITFYYHGKPREAKRAPWDGGWIWTKDSLGRPWMTVACQGLGASVWYPCKDYQGDEPDNGAILRITVPDTLVAVGNGRLKNTVKKNGLATYTWEVINPINNYNIVPYIGKYVHWEDTINGLKGKLDLQYWALDYDEARARTQFLQSKSMLHCFEYWFGPYPFYDDSYKLVEAPHLGMEHQSAVAYGNHFKNGYLGRDLSGTGWGLKWDFIIIHESGHEWFANNITTKDIADMWVHEGFTNYSESLYTECLFGKEAGNEYVYGTRKNIQNDIPIIGKYGVNNEGSGDMYYKSGNMIQAIRHIINDDALFRSILTGLNKTFYHQTVTTGRVENYINKKSGIDFNKVFDQYLRTTQIPTFHYYLSNDQRAITFRWENCVPGFNMPLVFPKDQNQAALILKPTEEWQTVKLKNEELEFFTSDYIDKNYYVQISNANPNF